MLVDTLVRKREKKGKKDGSRIAYILLSLIIIYTIMYSFVFMVGPSHMGDDVAYSYLAYYSSKGTFVQSASNILSIRILHIIPIGFFYSLFGASIVSSAAWDGISFLLSVILVFLIGKEIYNDHVGLLAAFLLAIFPLAAVYSTTMSDNIPMMFFVCLAVFAFIKAVKKNTKMWYLFAGMALVLPPLAIPEGFVLWIIIGLYIIIELLRKKLTINRTTLFFVYGFVIVIAVLLLFNYINSGHPLITFTANMLYYSQTWRPDLLPLPINTVLGFYPNLMFPCHLLSSLYNGITRGKRIPLTFFDRRMAGGEMFLSFNKSAAWS